MKRGDPGYWSKANKVGRPKKLKSPKILMDAAKEYFEWCHANPVIKNEMIKSGEHAGSIVAVPVLRPYTWMGLEMWLYDKKIIAKLDDYRANKNDNYSDFSDTLMHITNIIRDQQLTGGLADIFNSNLISRVLGLSEKSESTVTIEQPLFPDSE